MNYLYFLTDPVYSPVGCGGIFPAIPYLDVIQTIQNNIIIDVLSISTLLFPVAAPSVNKKKYK